MRRNFWIALLAALCLPVLYHPPALAQTAPEEDGAAITALVAAMEQAVLEQDRDAYLLLVDFSDPIFASEHTYWIDDWASGDPLDRFSMTVADLQVAGDAAEGWLSIRWAMLPDTSYRLAEYPARFVRGEDGAWRYAGEAWVPVETDHFLVRAFPGMEDAADQLIAALPDIYDHATTSLDYDPEAIIEIKLYPDQDTLGASIALSLPPIAGWNEPGESLKMLAEAGEIPSRAVLAHELTHFLTFDMAGTSHGHFPWWVEEGIAQVVSEKYRAEEWPFGQVAFVWDLFSQGRLAPWDQISNYEETPVQLWRYVYPQGYTFVRYVTETFGDSKRNAWLRDMAGSMDLGEATEAAFGKTFAELDQGFPVWLEENTPG